MGSSCNNLGNLLKERGTELLQRRALAIREKAFDAETTYVASSCNNLRTVLNDRGKPDESELLQRRALAIREEVFDAESP